jgi:hypothetical protein
MSTFPGAFVPVAPPADGLRLAFVTARRRRNTKAGATGAAGLLAAVVLLASTGGAGNRTLLQEPLPPASTTGLELLPGGGLPSAAPSAPAAAVSVVDVGSAPGVGTGASGARLTPGTRQEPAGGPDQASRGGFRTASTKTVSGPMTRGYSYGYTNGDLICPARKQQEGARGLCTDVTAYASSPGIQTITAEICNVGASTERLSYSTARELDITVRHAGLDIWRWSLGRHFDATAHELSLGVGECLAWSTNWSQVDAQGVPVKGGSYVVAAEFDADQVAGPDRRPTYQITVSSQP